MVFTYNDLGLATKSEQAHAGAVGMSTPSVQYAYDTSAASSVFDDGPRLESLTYPSGRVLFSDYGTADALADRLSVPEKLRETDGSGTILVQYSRTGSGAAVITDYQQPDLKLDLFGGTSGTYAGLDRFGRDVDHRWYDYTSGTVDRARYYYGYDLSGNRNWQEDPVAAAAMVGLDALYTYDGLNRLKSYDRGTLNSGHSSLDSTTFAQQWSLDQLNNWSGFDEDTDGNATNDLVQDRTHNDANEITAISATTGANWVDPTYDAAGNMITGPTPGDETSTQKYIYDAWNRLVMVADGSDVTLATFGYDARGYRITKGVYVTGSLDHTRHYYHTEQNQVVEERIDSSTDPDRQYTWGSRYIDDLVLRTRDTDSNGSLDETLYALHDANWSITALADTSGTVVERFRYDAYGRAAVLDADFAGDADGVSDDGWEYRFTSREWDADSGLHYFRARYYDDAGGRFLQRDPITYVDGMNLYGAFFVPYSIDAYGYSTDACACCNAHVREYVNGNRYGITKIDAPSGQRTCELQIRCRFGCSAGGTPFPASTQYVGNNTVIICIDCRLASMNLAATLVHEVRHARDLCDTPNLVPNLPNCIDFEGRACQDQCAFYQGVRTRNPMTGDYDVPDRIAYNQCVACCVYFSCQRFGQPEPPGGCPNFGVPTKPCYKWVPGVGFQRDRKDPRCTLHGGTRRPAFR